MASSLEIPQHLRKFLEDGETLRLQGYRGRFAPSPTGTLHLGNLRTAMISWLRARLSNGFWLLRIDDLDTPRNRLGSSESIQADLLWLGLDWDGPIVFQSSRKGIYHSVLSALRRQGRLYPCRCSRRNLANQIISKKKGFIYPGNCRDLNLSWGWEKGRLPSWRLRVAQKFSSSCGDIVLKRSDGFVAYHLATVVDDLTLGITEVVRGEDLFVAKSAQLAVTDLLSEWPLKYQHVPLLYDDRGEKFAKREGSQGLERLREKGMSSAKIIGWLAASLGLVPIGSELTASELLADLVRDDSCIKRLFEN